MITPGIAASLTPTSTQRPQRSTLPVLRLHLPRVRLQVPHLHLPHRHA